jgi:hypothetical protein
MGPSSFAGLSKLIPEAAAKESGRPAAAGGSGRQGGAAAGGGDGSSLLSMLKEKKSSNAGAGLDSSILKQHVAAVGAKFKAGSNNSSRKDDATSRGAWEY